MNWETRSLPHPTTRLQKTSAAHHRTYVVGGWRLAVLKFTFTPLLAWQLLAANAFAADILQVDLIPQGARARNQSPIPVEARFKWNSARLLEGRLEMEFLDGNRVLGRYRSGEMALTGGEQKFRMLLPPSLAPFSDSQVQVQMKFVTAGNAVNLEPSVLFLPTASERSSRATARKRHSRRPNWTNWTSRGTTSSTFPATRSCTRATPARSSRS